MAAEQVRDGDPTVTPMRLGAQPRTSAPAPDMAELESEVANLRRGLESRTQIALAIGLVAERFQCSSAQAWALLQRLSSHTNLKLRRVADLLVAEADGTCTDHDTGELAQLATHVPGLFRARTHARTP